MTPKMYNRFRSLSIAVFHTTHYLNRMNWRRYTRAIHPLQLTFNRGCPDPLSSTLTQVMVVGVPEAVYTNAVYLKGTCRNHCVTRGCCPVDRTLVSAVMPIGARGHEC